jgi:hypothetical protein
MAYRVCRLAVALSLFLAPLPALSANIGVTSAVLPEATGTPPDAQPRILEVGIDVVADERIVTGDVGKTHLLFQDGSALTVGPKSDLMLDEFVYDPGRKTGAIALSATKGLLRFVGGRISKTSPVQIRTPTATIGIRGGIVILAIGDAQVTAKFLFGQEMTVSANGQSVTVSRPGFQVTVPTGGPPGNPSPIPPQELTDNVGDLEGSPDQTGDTQSLISENDVAGSQLSQLGSSNQPTTVGPTDPNQAPAPDGLPPPIIEETQTDRPPDAGGGGDTGIAFGAPFVDVGNSATTVLAAIMPFASAIITDPDSAQITVVVVIENPAQGSFTDSSLTASGFVSLGSGVFSYTGSPAQAQAALQLLTFVSADQRISTGGSETVTFAVTVTDNSFLVAADPSPQLTVTCATFCNYSFNGRVKIGTDTSVGTIDGTAASNAAFTGTSSLVAGQRFAFTTSQGAFSLPVPASPGEFNFTAEGTPFGTVTGEGYLSQFGDFVFYELTGSQIIAFAGVPTTGFVPGGSFLAATYRLEDDFTLGDSDVPFIPQPFQTNITNGFEPTMTMLLGTQSGGDRFFFAGNVLIDGTGSGQGTAGSLLIGTGQTPGSGGGGFFLSGRARGLADAGNTGFLPSAFTGAVATADDGGGFDFFGTAGPRYAVLISDNVDGNDASLGGGGITPTQGNESAGSTIFPNVPAINEQANLGTFTPAPGPANNQRTTRTLQGYAAGAALERDGSNNPVEVAGFSPDIQSVSTNAYESFTLGTDAVTNRIVVSMSLNSDLGGFLGDDQTVIGFGGNFATDAGRSAFLNNSTFAAIEPTANVLVNNNTGTLRGFFLTNNQIAFRGGALSGVTLCNCSELQWGVFTGVLTDDNGTPMATSDDVTYEFGLAQWVAGTPASISQIPMTGTASYTGHVIASIADGMPNDPANVQRYTALGSISLNLLFASGDIQIDSGSVMALDNTNYSIVQPVEDNGFPAPEFEFEINGPGRSGFGTGALFGSGTPPSQAGGHFRITTDGGPTDYQASGIVAADLN